MPREWKTIVESLTERESECVVLVASGLSVDAIAKKLFRSRLTVQNQVNTAKAKLGVRETSQLVRVAVAAGLVPVEFEVGT